MIGEKILKIMSEIKAIEKTELDTENNYKFAKSEEIIGMVKPLLEKYKVIILPIKVVNFSSHGDKVYIIMKYQIIDVEDASKDCVEVEIPASGYDKKGRAVYGALTGAYRYAMQEVFAIPIVDEITNDDNSKKEEKTENNEISSDNIQEDSENSKSIEDIDENDLDNLFMMENIE